MQVLVLENAILSVLPFLKSFIKLIFLSQYDNKKLLMNAPILHISWLFTLRPHFQLPDSNSALSLFQTMGPEFLVGGDNLHHIHRLSPGIVLDIKDIPQGCACIITISFFDITTSYFCNSKLNYPNDIALLMIMNLIYTDWFADYLLQKKKTVTRIPRFVIFVIQSHKMLANLANSD